MIELAVAFVGVEVVAKLLVLRVDCLKSMTRLLPVIRGLLYYQQQLDQYKLLPFGWRNKLLLSYVEPPRHLLTTDNVH